MSHYSASLYVGDLHPQVNESFLYEVFSEVGPILSIKVCRDAMTGSSLGYAYVNFQNPKDAERAIDTLNYTPIKGKPIRIMWSQRDPAVRRSGEGNIFIKNLDKTVDNKSLYDTFSIFGNILSCKVATTNFGDKTAKPVSLGYGFVHFQTQKAAQDAIKTVNGMLIKGKKVFVGTFLSREERDLNKKPLKFTNIFVKNVSSEVANNDILKEFGKFGDITSTDIREQKVLGKKFAFINYKNSEDAQKALSLNGKPFGGKEEVIYVSRAQVKTERELYLQKEYEKRRAEYMKKYQGTNLYVKNIDDTFTEEKLNEIFSKYGKILSCVVMKDEKKKSRGFGFVCFSEVDDANKALLELNGKMVGSKPLYVAVAQRKIIRKQFLEQQFQHQHFRGVQPMFQQNSYQNNQSNSEQSQQNSQFYKNQQGAQKNNRYQNRNNSNQQFNNNNNRSNPKKKNQSQNQNQNPGLNKRGYKYNQNARNRPDQQNSQQSKKQVRSNQQSQQVDVLNPTFLAQHSSQQQKRFLGDRIYPLVHSSHPEQANKITGMLLEMETGDILHLLENRDALNAKITEALNVLKENEKKKSGDNKPVEEVKKEEKSTTEEKKD